MNFLTYLEGQFQEKTHLTDTFLAQVRNCLRGEFLCAGLDFDAKEDVTTIIEDAYKYCTAYITEISRSLSDWEKSRNLLTTLAWYTWDAKADRGQFQASNELQELVQSIPNILEKTDKTFVFKVELFHNYFLARYLLEKGVQTVIGSHIKQALPLNTLALLAGSRSLKPADFDRLVETVRTYRKFPARFHCYLVLFATPEGSKSEVLHKQVLQDRAKKIRALVPRAYALNPTPELERATRVAFNENSDHTIRKLAFEELVFNLEEENELHALIKVGVNDHDYEIQKLAKKFAKDYDIDIAISEGQIAKAEITESVITEEETQEFLDVTPLIKRARSGSIGGRISALAEMHPLNHPDLLAFAVSALKLKKFHDFRLVEKLLPVVTNYKEAEAVQFLTEYACGIVNTPRHAFFTVKKLFSEYFINLPKEQVILVLEVIFKAISESSEVEVEANLNEYRLMYFLSQNPNFSSKWIIEVFQDALEKHDQPFFQNRVKRIYHQFLFHTKTYDDAVFEEKLQKLAKTYISDHSHSRKYQEPNLRELVEYIVPFAIEKQLTHVLPAFSSPGSTTSSMITLWYILQAQCTLAPDTAETQKMIKRFLSLDKLYVSMDESPVILDYWFEVASMAREKKLLPEENLRQLTLKLLKETAYPKSIGKEPWRTTIIHNFPAKFTIFFDPPYLDLHLEILEIYASIWCFWIPKKDNVDVYVFFDSERSLYQKNFPEFFEGMHPLFERIRGDSKNFYLFLFQLTNPSAHHIQNHKNRTSFYASHAKFFLDQIRAIIEEGKASPEMVQAAKYAVLALLTKNFSRFEEVVCEGYPDARGIAERLQSDDWEGYKRSHISSSHVIIAQATFLLELDVELFREALPELLSHTQEDVRKFAQKLAKEQKLIPKIEEPETRFEQLLKDARQALLESSGGWYYQKEDKEISINSSYRSVEKHLKAALDFIKVSNIDMISQLKKADLLDNILLLRLIGLGTLKEYTEVVKEIFWQTSYPPNLPVTKPTNLQEYFKWSINLKKYIKWSSDEKQEYFNWRAIPAMQQFELKATALWLLVNLTPQKVQTEILPLLKQDLRTKEMIYLIYWVSLISPAQGGPLVLEWYISCKGQSEEADARKFLIEQWLFWKINAKFPLELVKDFFPVQQKEEITFLTMQASKITKTDFKSLDNKKDYGKFLSELAKAIKPSKWTRGVFTKTMRRITDVEVFRTFLDGYKDYLGELIERAKTNPKIRWFEGKDPHRYHWEFLDWLVRILDRKRAADLILEFLFRYATTPLIYISDVDWHKLFRYLPDRYETQEFASMFLEFIKRQYDDFINGSLDRVLLTNLFYLATLIPKTTDQFKEDLVSNYILKERFKEWIADSHKISLTLTNWGYAKKIKPLIDAKLTVKTGYYGGEEYIEWLGDFGALFPGENNIIKEKLVEISQKDDKKMQSAATSALKKLGYYA